MAIAFDAAGSGPSTAAASLTFSHTCTGSNLVLLVGVLTNGTITGVTYNGVALTLIDTATFSPSPTFHNTVWGLIAPATGAHNVVVSLSGSATVCAVSASYTGATQTTLPDNHGNDSAVNATNYARSLTPVADNCWIVLLAQNSAGAVSGVTNYTNRGQASGQNFGIGDTNGAIHPAASTTLTVTEGAATTWDSIIVSIAPVGSGSTGNMFLMF